MLDGEVYATDSLKYGEEIVLRDEPTKEGHTFSGWMCEYTIMPAKDIVVEGSFNITGISEIITDRLVDVYSLQGVIIKRKINVSELEMELSSGVYIINGKKVYIKQQ